MTADQIKYMDPKEFQELGFLQEANRLFFHPLGLALDVSINTETGEVSIGGIWDYREEPEGIIFDSAIMNTDRASEKAVRVAEEWLRHAAARTKVLGSVIQQTTRPSSGI